MKNAVQFVVIVALMSLPSTTAACGMCGFGMLEYALPHSILWAHGTATWFFAVMVLTATDNKASRFAGALVMVFLAYFIGLAYVGPCAFMLLGCIAFCITVKNCGQKAKQKLSRSSRIGFTLVSIAAFFAVPAGCSISAHTRSNRSDAEFILSWGGYKSKAVLHKLVSDPEQYEDQLRQILAQTEDEDMAEEITEALATIEGNRDEQAEDMP